MVFGVAADHDLGRFYRRGKKKLCLIKNEDGLAGRQVIGWDITKSGGERKFMVGPMSELNLVDFLFFGYFLGLEEWRVDDDKSLSQKLN